MATPSYLGQTQRVATSDDWFAKIASVFAGSGTPMYLGAGQPASTSNAFLRGVATPIYAAAPVREPTTSEADLASTAEGMSAACAESCPIDPVALAAGQIAIVIPRERLGP